MGYVVAVAAACLISSSVSAHLAQATPPAGDGPAQPAVTLPPALDRVLRDYEAAWRGGDGQRLASIFTDDGFAIQSGSPLARGHAAIARTVTGPGGGLQLTAYAYAIDGTVGYIVGGYRYPQTTGPGGRFVLALKQGAGGRWLIAADLDNTGPRPR